MAINEEAEYFPHDSPVCQGRLPGCSDLIAPSRSISPYAMLEFGKCVEAVDDGQVVAFHDNREGEQIWTTQLPSHTMVDRCEWSIDVQL